MPDDMLEDAIAISKKTLDEHDFETDGVEVSKDKLCVWRRMNFISNCQSHRVVFLNQ
jgi:hypothetical protein